MEFFLHNLINLKTEESKCVVNLSQSINNTKGVGESKISMIELFIHAHNCVLIPWNQFILLSYSQIYTFNTLVLYDYI